MFRRSAETFYNSLLQGQTTLGKIFSNFPFLFLIFKVLVENGNYRIAQGANPNILPNFHGGVLYRNHQFFYQKTPKRDIKFELKNFVFAPISQKAFLFLQITLIIVCELHLLVGFLLKLSIDRPNSILILN